MLTLNYYAMKTKLSQIFRVAATLISIVGFSISMYAHSVQMAYCANCQGSLRLWIEHWHGNQAVGTTTMTISLTTGGITTTTTGSPLTNVQNTPLNQLPGCNTNPVIFASCPNSMNLYLDWVNYDFPAVPCGVPVNITVISGNSAFTMDACGMMPASTGTFTIPCNINKPTASFIPPASVCVGTPMTFIDNSTGGNPLFYSWDFGDGSPISTQQNPTHTYAAPGTYCVTLRARKTINGCDDDTTICVVVEDVPNPGFTVVPKCNGYPTPFTDVSTIANGTITQWAWDFGDGNTSAVQNPNHVYANCGTYNVKLIVYSNGGCVDSITQQVVIPCTPTASFTYDTACFGSPVNFTDLSNVQGGQITAWFWDFGNNQGTSGAQHPQYTYPNHGTYTVTLTVTSSGGCVATVQHQVTVWPAATSNFLATTVCLGNPTVFTDQSTTTSGPPAGWTWDFGDGIGTSIVQNPTYMYTAPGTYQVKLVTSAGSVCKDSLTQLVTVNDTPNVAFVTADVCYGNQMVFTNNTNIGTGTITGYSWDFGNLQGYSNQQHPTYNYPFAGGYTVTLTATSDQGCVGSAKLPVNVHPQPNVSWTRSKTCEGDPMQFTNYTQIQGGNPNWVWNFNGLGASAGQHPQFTFPGGGQYTVSLVARTPFGCIDSLVKDVYVNYKPTVDFVADKLKGCAPLCPNFQDLSVVTGSNISKWNWSFGNGTGSFAQHPQKCFENETSSYRVYDATLTVTSDSGCVATLTKFDYITVYPVPDAEFEAEPSIVQISNPTIDFLNQSSGEKTWTWNFGDGTTSSTVYNPSHEYQDTGRYTVWLYVYNEWGCSDSTATIVKVEPEAFVYIPNAFTPNGDGRNDYWFPKYDGVVEATSSIFNRWGELIWTGTELDSKWNGQYKDQEVKTDSYVYLVQVTTVRGEYKEFRGRVAVLK